MAWPASGDAVIAEANDLTGAIGQMFQDIASGAKAVAITAINVSPVEYDTDQSPPVPTLFQVTITCEAGGTYNEENTQKLIEVKEALGL